MKREEPNSPDFSRKRGNSGGAERSSPESGHHTPKWNVTVRGSEEEGWKHGVTSPWSVRPEGKSGKKQEPEKRRDQLEPGYR